MANDELLLIEEAAALTRQPVATLRWMRHCGTGPRSGKLGRRVVYKRSDVERWIEEQFTGSLGNGGDSDAA